MKIQLCKCGHIKSDHQQNSKKHRTYCLCWNCECTEFIFDKIESKTFPKYIGPDAILVPDTEEPQRKRKYQKTFTMNNLRNDGTPRNL